MTMTMSEYILYKSVSLTANVKFHHKNVFNTSQTSNDEIINVYFNIYIYHIFAYLIFTYIINFFWLNLKIYQDGIYTSNIIT